MKIDTPNPQADVGQDGNFDPVWTAFLTKVQQYISRYSQTGTTAQRPTKLVNVGQPYFDTTLGRPIWVQSVGPIVWIKADGTVV